MGGIVAKITGQPTAQEKRKMAAEEKKKQRAIDSETNTIDRFQQSFEKDFLSSFKQMDKAALPEDSPHKEAASEHPYHDEDRFHVDYKRIDNLLEFCKKQGERFKKESFEHLQERRDELVKKLDDHKQQLIDAYREWLKQWMMCVRQTNPYRRGDLFSIVRNYFEDDKELNQVMKDAMDTMNDKVKKFEEEIADGVNKKWDEFMEKRKEVKTAVIDELRAKASELRPKYEEWLASSGAVDAVNGQTGFEQVDGKYVNYKPSTEDTVNVGINMTMDWFIDPGTNGHGNWVIDYSEQVKAAWNKVDEYVAKKTDDLYNETFPNGCSYSLVNSGIWILPIDTVVKVTGQGPATFQEWEEFKPINEQEYEKTHGREALNNLRRRFSYDNVGRCVGDKHYKGVTIDRNCIKATVEAMTKEDWFIAFPGGAVTDGLSF